VGVNDLNHVTLAKNPKPKLPADVGPALHKGHKELILQLKESGFDYLFDSGFSPVALASRFRKIIRNFS